MKSRPIPVLTRLVSTSRKDLERDLPTITPIHVLEISQFLVACDLSYDSRIAGLMFPGYSSAVDEFKEDFAWAVGPAAAPAADPPAGDAPADGLAR